MKIGIGMPLPPDPPDVVVDMAVYAREAERLGFESVWIQEHVVAPVDTGSSQEIFYGGQVPGFLDPIVAMARASAVTSTIRLGTAVLLVTEHNPLLLAKEIATVDYLSGGRTAWGMGTGWLREEAEILGVDFDHRWSQAKEAVLAMKELWTKEQAEFHGKYYDFPPVRCWPQPAQKPHPPILLGSYAPNTFKRIVAYADGWCPGRGRPDYIKQGRTTLDRLAEEAGRDPKSIGISMHTQPPERERMKQYEEAGVEEYIVRPEMTTSERAALQEMERIAEIVLR